MATSRRMQVAASIGAVALLAGAWVLTQRSADDDDRAPADRAAVATTTRPARASTTSTSAAATTSTIPRPANTEWGALNLTDVTEAAGFDEPHATKEPTGADGQAGGVAVADYDDDGDQDVFLTRVGLPNRLMRNDGEGSFEDVAADAGVEGADTDSGYAAPVWADVDGDGDLDLFLTGAGRGGAQLLINDGKGRFRDGTKAAGLDGLAGDGLAGTASFGAAMADWDNDGDLDLVSLQWYKAPFELQLQNDPPTQTSNPLDFEPCRLAEKRLQNPMEGLPGSRSRLFENDGSGRFSDVTAASGVAVDEIIGFQPVFEDIDADGWEDLFITGDFCTSRLYRNREGNGFEDVTKEAGVGTDQNGMGSLITDLDGDGNVDWFVSSIAATGLDGCAPEDPCNRAGNRLYLGDGAGRFTDATNQFGVRNGSWGWGAVGADLNQDGRTDLVLANGVRYNQLNAEDPTLSAGDEDADDPTAVWVNTGTGPWPEAADAVGVRDRANGKGIVAFDADGDGDLDVLIANTEVAPVFYRNDTPAGDGNHWLQLRLRAPGTTNPFGVGARVTVDVGDGRPARPLTVRAGGSFQSSDPTDLHLGLGASDRVASIEVRWPGDPTPQVIRDVEADQVLEINRPS